MGLLLSRIGFKQSHKTVGMGYGSGLSNTASMTEKIALLAPMPSARVSTTPQKNAGRRNRLR